MSDCSIPSSGGGVFVTGTYDGNDAAERTISVGFTPSAVILCSYSGLMVTDGGGVYGGIDVGDGDTGVKIVAGGFQVFYKNPIHTNSRGRHFKYIAFR